MYIAGIVATSILITALVVLMAFLYSYWVYTKNRLFTKPKLSILVVVLISIIFVLLLTIGIYLAANNPTDPSQRNVYKANAILIIICSFLMLADLAAYITITMLNKKNKISYADIATINWSAKADELKANVNIEQLKLKLANKSFYQRMLNDYKEILLRAKDEALPLADKMADIVVFNEKYTDKWSKSNNNLQLLLTYEFLKIFNK